MGKDKNPDIVNLVVEVPEKLHRQFKSRTSANGVSIKEAITEFMEKYT